MPLLGPVVVRVADWTQPRRGTAPMFERPPLLERFAMANPAIPFIVYFPVGIYTAWRAVSHGYGALTIAAMYLAGLFLWTFTEYAVHRGQFHHEPTSEPQVAYVYLMHGVHHAYPDDSRRWVMPLIVSVPLSALFYLAFHFLLGPIGDAMFAGFIHGYVAYDTIHFLVHRGPMPTRFGKFLRQYHMEHHYKKLEGHYGVSSPLWDVVFRTR
jgi:dihydroceramide fatty acyl 2-hydroxylase